MFDEHTISGEICRLVEGHLPRGTADNAFYIPLHLTAWKPNMIGRELAMGFLVWRPRAYTLVAVRPDIVGFSRLQVTEFQVKAYHDSAWRSDGVEDSVRNAFAHLRDIQPKTPAPIFTQAKILLGSGDFGIFSVDDVIFDSQDYTAPAIVRWSTQ